VAGSSFLLAGKKEDKSIKENLFYLCDIIYILDLEVEGPKTNLKRVRKAFVKSSFSFPSLPV